MRGVFTTEPVSAGEEICGSDSASGIQPLSEFMPKMGRTYVARSMLLEDHRFELLLLVCVCVSPSTPYIQKGWDGRSETEGLCISS